MLHYLLIGAALSVGQSEILPPGSISTFDPVPPLPRLVLSQPEKAPEVPPLTPPAPPKQPPPVMGPALSVGESRTPPPGTTSTSDPVPPAPQLVLSQPEKQPEKPPELPPPEEEEKPPVPAVQPPAPGPTPPDRWGLMRCLQGT